jgi:hypothetical protein
MKKNDLIALVFALVLLVGVGYYFLSHNGSSTTSSTASDNSQVEVAPNIPADVDPSGTLGKMSSTYKVQDYKQTVNLNGLGNTAPFGN